MKTSKGIESKLRKEFKEYFKDYDRLSLPPSLKKLEAVSALV